MEYQAYEWQLYFFVASRTFVAVGYAARHCEFRELFSAADQSTIDDWFSTSTFVPFGVVTVATARAMVDRDFLVKRYEMW